MLKYGREVWGFLTLTIENGSIHGVTTGVDRDGSVTVGDTFDYPTAGNPPARSEVGADAVGGIIRTARAFCSRAEAV